MLQNKTCFPVTILLSGTLWKLEAAEQIIHPCSRGMESGSTCLPEQQLKRCLFFLQLMLPVLGNVSITVEWHFKKTIFGFQGLSFMFRARFRHLRTLLGRERNIKVNNYDRVVEFILEIMHLRLLFLVLSPMWGCHAELHRRDDIWDGSWRVVGIHWAHQSATPLEGGGGGCRLQVAWGLEQWGPLWRWFVNHAHWWKAFK